ncbi:unnamed protein product [Hymenolepis diminuta]|nr:unnamed protein product [Hymenolepis diminuta]
MNLQDKGKLLQYFQDDDCPNSKMRRYPKMTPTEARDSKYWAKRIKNNAAARRSRQSRRVRELNLAEHAARLEERCCILENQIQYLQVQLIEAKQSRIDDEEYSHYTK